MNIIKRTLRSLAIGMSYTKRDSITNKIDQLNPEVVSFDVFDTLISRNVENPEDVFILLEKQYKKCYGLDKPIKEYRIQAEGRARSRSSREDVSIDEIYQNMAQIDEAERSWLINCEIDLELKICTANNSIKKIFEYCREKKHRIIIISDMYLGKSVISRILEKSGYSDISAVYVSSDIGFKKSTGNIFDVVLKKEAIDAKNIVHIGDAIKGDYYAPKSKGIHAILIQNSKKAFFCGNGKGKECKEPASSMLSMFIKNQNDSCKDWFEYFGFEILGPMLYGYCKWLKNRCAIDDIKHLLFLAREGILIEKAFQLYGDVGVGHSVLRVSRRSLSLPRLYDISDFDSMLAKMEVVRGGTA